MKAISTVLCQAFTNTVLWNQVFRVVWYKFSIVSNYRSPFLAQVKRQSTVRIMSGYNLPMVSWMASWSVSTGSAETTDTACMRFANSMACLTNIIPIFSRLFSKFLNIGAMAYERCEKGHIVKQWCSQPFLGVSFQKMCMSISFGRP